MVSRTGLIICSNIRKTRRQLITVFLLVFLASMLLNVVLVLKLDYNQTFERDMEKLNVSHFRIAYTDPYGQVQERTLSDCLKEEPGIKDFEIDQGYMGEGDAESVNGSVSSLIVLESFSAAEKKHIDRFEILEDDECVTDGAYVSYLFKTFGMKTGDPCRVSLGNDTFEFPIKGFYNNSVLGTVNCGGIAYILSDRLYEKTAGDKPVSYLIEIQCGDRSRITEVFNNTVGRLNGLSPTGYVCRSAFADEIGVSRYTNSNLFRIILTFAAVTMVIIMLAIIAIVMSNFVNASVRAFGTFKALGYTSDMLMIPMLLEVAVICLAAGIAGTGGSYAILPAISRALESQSGIPYTVRFLVRPCIWTLTVCELTSLASTYLSVRRVRNISAVHAIRNLQENSGKRQDGVKLEKTKLQVNAAIGLDTAFRFIPRSIVLFLTSAGITFLLGISLFIYQNLIVDNTDLVKVICGEIPNYIVSVGRSDEKALTEYLNSSSMVRDSYLYQMTDQVPDDQPVISFIGVDRDSCVASLDYLIVEGRFPQEIDEISVNKLYAVSNGVSLNDELTFTRDGKKYTCRVVGFNQGAARSGTEGYILREGLDRISNARGITYYIFLKDNGEETAFREDILEKIPVQYILNNRQNVFSMVDMYMLILVILAVILCVISILIAGFVIYVILSLLLNNRRKEHGILKALGFTSRDLVIQAEYSILPFTVAGSAAGLIAARTRVGDLISLALNSIGIFDFGSPLRITYLFILWLILLVFTAGFVAVLCSSISGITTRELFNAE